eukprot:452489-Amphidinium_carterae.1
MQATLIGQEIVGPTPNFPMRSFFHSLLRSSLLAKNSKTPTGPPCRTARRDKGAEVAKLLSRRPCWVAAFPQ